MTKTELAYLAGIIEGEGSIALYRGNSRKHKTGFQIHPTLKVTNTNLRLLKHLKKLTGLGGICSYTHKNKPNWKKCYVWQIYGNNVGTILRSVLPYLVIKRKQAILVISFVTRHCKYGRRLTKFDVNHQLDLHTKVAKLNKRGN